MLTVLFLVCCNSPQKLLKEARLAEKSGNIEDAANLYFNVLVQHPEQKEANKGLALNGQKVLADKFARFSKQVIDGNIDEAVRTYQYALDYAQNAKKVSVLLDWPTEYDEVYLDIKKDFLIRKFDLAIDLIQDKKFETAERVFEQMAKVDTAFKHVSVLRLNTVLEPVYQKGIDAYNSGRYQDAYYLFEKVILLDDGYKDASKYKKMAQQKATLVFGILPIKYNNSLPNKLNFLPTLTDLLLQLEGQYIRLANVNSLHNDLENRGFNQINSDSAIIEAAKTTGLSYALFMQVDTFYYQSFSGKSERNIAYEAFTENILNPYTQTYQSITRFKKVEYIDKSASQHYFIQLNYKLFNVLTGQKLIAETVKMLEKDEIHAAIFEGNPANLYPVLPEDNYLPQVSQEWHDMFFSPRKNLLTKEVLLEKLEKDLAQKIAVKVKEFTK